MTHHPTTDLAKHTPLSDDLGTRVAIFLTNARPELAAVAVKAHDGVAELSGEVPTFYLRQLAVACARRVAGVRRVVDNIQVSNRYSAADGRPLRPR
jgi:hypothetical protein